MVRGVKGERIVLTVRDRLEKALKYELVLFQFYQDLANRLSDTELGQACQQMAARAEEHARLIKRWLVCPT